jgi:hypothetical protein
MWTSVGPWVWARTPALRLAEFPDESNITWHGHAPGKGFIENKHSTEVESIVELESLHISIRNEGKPCFDRFECLFSMTLLLGKPLWEDESRFVAFTITAPEAGGEDAGRD